MDVPLSECILSMVTHKLDKEIKNETYTMITPSKAHIPDRIHNRTKFITPPTN